MKSSMHQQAVMSDTTDPAQQTTQQTPASDASAPDQQAAQQTPASDASAPDQQAAQQTPASDASAPDQQAAQQTPLTGKEREEMLEQRKHLIDLQSQSSQSFDATIVALAGGALTVSISFIRQTIPEALPGTTWTLVITWLFLLSALLSSLFSHFTSQFALMELVEELDVQYFGAPVVKQPSGKSLRWDRRILHKVRGKLSDICKDRMTTHWLNVASIICCVVGIGFLVLFVALNLSQLQVPLSK